MRDAKSGQWWLEDGQRKLANNSIAFTEKPDIGIFMEEWLALYRSKSGERGIFNRQAVYNKVKSLPDEKRNPELVIGVNPCVEILLRDEEFCNLSSSVIRPRDTVEQIMEKVRIAAVLGTWQATLTNFRYINNNWKKNCEEEALIGVSMTGIMAHPLFNHIHKDLPKILNDLRDHVITTNKSLSKKLGINPAAATTCIKPEGTSSSLVNSASGIHARHSKYYIRTVRENKRLPLSRFLIDQGVPFEDDVTKPDTDYVFSFPIESPSEAIFSADRGAIEQLELWKVYQDAYCEHKPSITVSVREHEWLEVGAWVYEHFDEVSGISFLPYSDHTYRQAPFQEIDKDKYDEISRSVPVNIDWEKLHDFETEDTTTSSQELACSGPEGCEII
jgi:ribonucleoside-diphosphate reductase alpha chain